MSASSTITMPASSRMTPISHGTACSAVDGLLLGLRLGDRRLRLGQRDRESAQPSARAPRARYARAPPAGSPSLVGSTWVASLRSPHGSGVQCGSGSGWGSGSRLGLRLWLGDPRISAIPPQRVALRERPEPRLEARTLCSDGDSDGLTAGSRLLGSGSGSGSGFGLGLGRARVRAPASGSALRFGSRLRFGFWFGFSFGLGLRFRLGLRFGLGLRLGLGLGLGLRLGLGHRFRLGLGLGRRLGLGLRLGLRLGLGLRFGLGLRLWPGLGLRLVDDQRPGICRCRAPGSADRAPGRRRRRTCPAPTASPPAAPIATGGPRESGSTSPRRRRRTTRAPRRRPPRLRFGRIGPGPRFG